MNCLKMLLKLILAAGINSWIGILPGCQVDGNLSEETLCWCGRPPSFFHGTWCRVITKLYGGV